MEKEQIIQAAKDLIEDAELMDGEYWGYLVSVSKVDALRQMIEEMEAQ